MEERRLKNMLCHLSSCSSSSLGNSAVLNMNNMERREESHVRIPDSARWNPPHLVEEEKAHRSLSKSRSSSSIFERKQLRFVKETFMGGLQSHPTTPSSHSADAQLKAGSQCKQTVSSSASFKQSTGDSSPKELPNTNFVPHAKLTAWKCRFLQRSKYFSSEVDGDSLCMHLNDRGATLRTNGRGGYDLDKTGLKAPALLPDANFFEVEAQCKFFNSNKVPDVGFQAGVQCHGCDITDDKNILAQGAIAPELRAEGNHDKIVDGEHQTSTKALDTLQSSEEENLLVCRDMHMRDPQPVKVGIDTSGNMGLIRNNVMTGQRRHIVEDCIFCLIIQGQSPAFKLYEDEMCVCILDVHPLTHGHSLLIPKAHFPSLELTPPEVAAAMCATVPFISMAIMQATNCDSFNLLVNSGKAAGQVVFHTHFHIIPRRSGDNLWRSEDGSRRALPVGHETALFVQQIRHNLSNKCL